MNIIINIATQQLALFDDDSQLLHTYQVSTAGRGVGEEENSFCTPRGQHVIRAKIGAGQPENAVFVGRRPTGEIYTPELGIAHPNRDWILTRILWLSGCEVGFNRGGSCDTMRRYVYIHGTPDSTILGQSGSRGCVRMRNRDLIELFELVGAGTTVKIIA